MSRIGRKQIDVPHGVEVVVKGQVVSVAGPKGRLEWVAPRPATVTVESGCVSVTVPSTARADRAIHGLVRAIVNNMVKGVVTPYEKKLEIQGVGYQASMSGKNLSLNVGFSHSVEVPVPDGVTCVLASPTLVVVSGCDRHLVGQFAANVRRVRPPEPYKGKGIRYQGEYVRRKAGKAFGSK